MSLYPNMSIGAPTPYRSTSAPIPYRSINASIPKRRIDAPRLPRKNIVLGRETL